ncbi:MAG TPA: DUF6569 family protein [Tepidisphaeraceae bacterium]
MRSRASIVMAAAFGLVLLAGLNAACGAASSPPGAGPVKVGDYTLTGPFVHDNLAVFLIHGADRLKDRNYLTLQEALEQKVVIVHETGNVNQLTIENVTSDKQVYVQSGDIVKGGRQDRVIAIDFIVPPNSKAMPIEAFCVEHGRWTARGAEPAAYFGASTEQAAGKDLKLAAKQRMDQSEVWQQVAANQQKLSDNAGGEVRAAQSASSFQLSLESKPVEDRTAAYIKALEPFVQGKDDVIGYAFAINGKVNSADVYANHALFVKLWPKLLKSSAVEAVAELQKGEKGGSTAEAKASDVQRCIDDAERGKKSEKDVTPRVQLITKETDENVVFETHDRDGSAAAPVHENYVNKK